MTTTIRIPRTAVSRREPTYARLLCRIHADRAVNIFEGELLRTGSTIEHSALWPDSSYPAVPLLLEFAGIDRSLPVRRGNRSNRIHVLWRYTEQGWSEIVRTSSQGAEWVSHMRLIALAELGGRLPPDPARAETAARSFVSELDVQLRELGKVERLIALQLVHDQLLARMVDEPILVL